MAIVQFDPYGSLVTKAMNKEYDLDTDAVKAAFVTAAYTPDRGAHAYWSDVSINEMAAAGSYVTGGITLTTKAVSLVEANAWARARADTTAYNVGEIMRPAVGNGFVYRVSVAGTSGGAPPTFPTVIGREVTDGTMILTCVGRRVFRFTADPISSANILSTSSWRYLVLYVDTAGLPSTDVLLGLIDHGTTQTGGDAAVTYTPDSANGFLSIPLA